MTSSGDMLRSQKGKTSPSFLVAVILVVAAVVGVVGWRYLKPNPFKQSEAVVRESGRNFRTQLGDFEQELNALLKKPGLDAAQRIEAIEKQAETAKAAIDRYVDEGRAQLADLEIPLKTHQNRADRLGQKADEAKSMIDDRVSEKRAQLSSG